MLEETVRILIVEARFYEHIADELLTGAKRVLEAAGAEYDVITVPGALEIPSAVAIAEESGHRPAGIRYDGYVALGCVIRGETYHFEVVSNESARGLVELGAARRLAIGNGILTVENEAQARARSDPAAGDKGGGAAHACLVMVALRRKLLGQSR
jgi:6,7-dimethyl-8-ribityllumazine synthase